MTSSCHWLCWLPWLPNVIRDVMLCLLKFWLLFESLNDKLMTCEDHMFYIYKILSCYIWLREMTGGCHWLCRGLVHY
jgi:hypothetical protein